MGNERWWGSVALSDLDEDIVNIESAEVFLNNMREACLSARRSRRWVGRYLSILFAVGGFLLAVLGTCSLFFGLVTGGSVIGSILMLGAAVGLIIACLVVHSMGDAVYARQEQLAVQNYETQWREFARTLSLKRIYGDATFNWLDNLGFRDIVLYGDMLDAVTILVNDAYETEIENIIFQIADVSALGLDGDMSFVGQYIATLDCKRPTNTVFMRSRGSSYKVPIGLERIDSVGDEAFDRVYEVFGDMSDAFYAMSPQAMESFVMLAEYVGGDIAVVWKEGGMHVALNTSEDLLEPPSVDDELHLELSIRKASEELGRVVDVLRMVSLGESRDVFAGDWRLSE